jgi:glycosyltransferase involved in cell wall biosynthesis
MLVSVAICTWNRADMLAQTLERFTRLEVPPGVDWELLVVNNNCTDHTDAVLAQFERRLPLRRVHEPTPGQSFARNRAIEEARGEYLLWTDDDVQVEPAWLVAYAAAFRRWPEAGVFGGPVRPWFEGTPPKWLDNVVSLVGDVFAVRDLGDTARPLAAPTHVPFGANMAFRTELLRDHRFDTTIGVRPGSEVRGEETKLIEQLLADGATGWWVPDARVLHFIPRQRQSVAYLRRWFRGVGEFHAFRAEGVDAPLFGAPRWAWRQLVELEARYALLRITGRPPARWVIAMRDASIARGFIAGRRRIAREASA